MMGDCVFIVPCLSCFSVYGSCDQGQGFLLPLARFLLAPPSDHVGVDLGEDFGAKEGTNLDGVDLVAHEESLPRKKAPSNSLLG